MASLKRIPWWRKLPLPFKWSVVLVVDAADEIPDKLPRSAAVRVQDGDQPKWIAFDCPCKRGHRVMLNLDQRRRPYWTVTASSRFTISPSVNDFSIDSNCHYFVRSGKIQWVPYTKAGGNHGN